MADQTGISWTDATWNPVVGCSKISPGCANCYAETLALRFGWTPKPWTPENAAENVILKPERLDQPLRWRKPRMVFVNSMSDLFHERVPDGFIARVFETMEIAERHTFQILTKRPERAAEWIAAYRRGRDPLPNVWLGVSIENARHTWRADVLREIPAVVRFISAEPLLGSLYANSNRTARIEGDLLHGWRKPLDLTGIDWLIVGGESGGRDSRPMHPDWARELRGDAISRGIALHFKQWGSWGPAESGIYPGDIFWTVTPGAAWEERYVVGDDHVCAPNESEAEHLRYHGASPKASGKILDGVEYCDFPSRIGATA
jgi:protein gp37